MATPCSGRCSTTALKFRAYRGGTRQHEVMSVMAKTLTDAEIDNLAAWFSSLQVTVQPVP